MNANTFLNGFFSSSLNVALQAVALRENAIGWQFTHTAPVAGGGGTFPDRASGMARDMVLRAAAMTASQSNSDGDSLPPASAPMFRAFATNFTTFAVATMLAMHGHGGDQSAPYQHQRLIQGQHQAVLCSETDYRLAAVDNRARSKRRTSDEGDAAVVPV